MSETTTIEWATHSWNPWEGCTKVSPGCANCYAEALNKRFRGGANWGKGKSRRRIIAETWRKPVKWNYEAGLWEDVRKRPRVFPSLCDWLDDEVPIEWLADFLKLIHDTPNLDWLLLTKRPEKFQQRMEAVRETEDAWVNESLVQDGIAMDWLNGFPPANVWIGTSVEDQQRADERIQALLKIPAGLRFLSVEPLLGPVDLTCLPGPNGRRALFRGNALSGDGFDGRGLDWVIVGGESGPGARPCNVEWIRSIVRQCNGVPCFVKQFGAAVISVNSIGWPDGSRGVSLPPYKESRFILKHPKGGDPAEWPEDLRVRQFPTLQPFNPSTLPP